MPPSLPCTVPDCDFVTPVNLTSEAAMQLLMMHRQDKHCPAPMLKSPDMQKCSTAKVEPPSRTAMKPEEWTNYMRQTGISDTTPIEELWTCMEPKLRELTLHGGFEAMLGTVNSLASLINHVSAEE